MFFGLFSALDGDGHPGVTSEFVAPFFFLHFDYHIVMKFSSIFKKKPRHDQPGVLASDVPTSSRSSLDISHPFDSEVLFQGKDPIIAE